MEKMKIPEFQALEEMANFWDTHDVTDFENEMQEVHEPIFDGMNNNIISLALTSDYYAKLKNIAELRKLNIISLVNKWIVDNIDCEVRAVGA